MSDDTSKESKAKFSFSLGTVIVLGLGGLATLWWGSTLLHWEGLLTFTTGYMLMVVLSFLRHRERLGDLDKEGVKEVLIPAYAALRAPEKTVARGQKVVVTEEQAFVLLVFAAAATIVLAILSMALVPPQFFGIAGIMYSISEGYFVGCAVHFWAAKPWQGFDMRKFGKVAGWPYYALRRPVIAEDSK